MLIRDIIPEASPDTPKGSITRDLLLSKLWLCHELEGRNLDSFDNIYILGSWYGALALLIQQRPIYFKNIICVDKSPEKANYLSRLIKHHNLKDLHSICKPCENIKYQGNRILVINTSTNDMNGDTWLSNIPDGALVVLQGRDNQVESNGVDTLKKFDSAYPLDKTLLLDEIQVIGVDRKPYQRFMKIGIL